MRGLQPWTSRAILPAQLTRLLFDPCVWTALHLPQALEDTRPDLTFAHPLFTFPSTRHFDYVTLGKCHQSNSGRE